MSRWLLTTLPMTLLALSAQAEPATDGCEARAARVVEQLEQQARAPLSPQEGQLAWRAALASCRGETQALAQSPAKPEGSRVERLVAGLFSMEPRMARKRPGGKARYLEKE